MYALNITFLSLLKISNFFFAIEEYTKQTTDFWIQLALYKEHYIYTRLSNTASYLHVMDSTKCLQHSFDSYQWC